MDWRCFEFYLAREFADENLQFWLSVDEYKRTKPTKLAKKAQEIYTEFLAPDAPSQINVDSATRTTIGQRLTAPDPERQLFDAAQRRVQHLMEADVYPRFLQSHLYQELLEDNNNTTTCATNSTVQR